MKDFDIEHEWPFHMSVHTPATLNEKLHLFIDDSSIRSRIRISDYLSVSGNYDGNNGHSSVRTWNTIKLELHKLYLDWKFNRHRKVLIHGEGGSGLARLVDEFIKSILKDPSNDKELQNTIHYSFLRINLHGVVNSSEFRETLQQEVPGINKKNGIRKITKKEELIYLLYLHIGTHFAKHRPADREIITSMPYPTLGPEKFSDPDFLVHFIRTVTISKRIIIHLNAIQHLFLKKIGGFEALETLLQIIEQTTGRVFWILSLNEHSYRYIRRIMRLDLFFPKTESIGIPPLDETDLYTLVSSKINTANDGVEFVFPDVKDYPYRGLFVTYRYHWKRLLYKISYFWKSKKGNCHSKKDTFFTLLTLGGRLCLLPFKYKGCSYRFIFEAKKTEKFILQKVLTSINTVKTLSDKESPIGDRPTLFNKMLQETLSVIRARFKDLHLNYAKNSDKIKRMHYYYTRDAISKYFILIYNHYRFFPLVSAQKIMGYNMIFIDEIEKIVWAQKTSTTKKSRNLLKQIRLHQLAFADAKRLIKILHINWFNNSKDRDSNPEEPETEIPSHIKEDPEYLKTYIETRNSYYDAFFAESKNPSRKNRPDGSILLLARNIRENLEELNTLSDQELQLKIDAAILSIPGKLEHYAKSLNLNRNGFMVRADLITGFIEKELVTLNESLPDQNNLHNLDRKKENLYYQELQELSHGNPFQALTYFIISMVHKDGKRVYLAPIQKIKLDLPQNLGLDYQLAMASVMQHGGMNAFELAEVMNWDIQKAKNIMENLYHSRIVHCFNSLEGDNCWSLINHTAYDSVVSFLKDHNLLYDE